MARAKERRRASARRRVETHDTGGGSNYVRLPDGVSFFQIKAGKHRLDFMSYVCKKGKGDDGGNPYFEKGELAFERTFFVHRDVGPNGDWHLCAAKSFGQPCPICEYRAKMARDPNADEEVMKELGPKERQLWIVKDMSDPDEVHVMEASYHLFGKQLDAKIRSGDEEDGYEFFADPVEGLTVRVNFEQSDRGKWVEATDIEFKARREQYDEDVVDEMPDLDSVLVATPYDKLKKLFLQTDDSEDAEDKQPKKKPKKQPTADDYGLSEGDLVLYGDEECEIVRISRDKTSLTLVDGDGEKHTAVGPEEVEKAAGKVPDDEEEDDDPPPKKKTTPKAKPKKAEPVDDDDDEDPPPKAAARGAKKTTKAAPKPADDDDDWDDEEDEEPVPKKATKGKAPAKKVKGEDPADDWDEWDD